MSARKKYALLGVLLRGSAPRNLQALLALFLVVAGTSCDKNPTYMSPCLTPEAITPNTTAEPGAGRSPKMTAPREDMGAASSDDEEDLDVGPCLELMMPEDMGREDDMAPAPESEPSSDEGEPEVPLNACLFMFHRDGGAHLDEAAHPARRQPRERSRREVLDRLADNLPRDVLARLRRELEES